MEDREDRRNRTLRYATRARNVYALFTGRIGGLKFLRPVGFYAKQKSLGCGCKRRGRTGSPKLINSMCHGGNGLHPSVVERIRGNRLAHGWLRALQAGVEPDDVEL
jgi:hypothetical protein